MSTRASAPSARAISTSCCWGMLSSPASISGSMRAPTRPSSSSARRCRSRQSTRPQRPVRSSAERDVLRDRQLAEQRGLLIDRRDAERLRGRGREPRERLAIERDLTGVRLHRAGEDLDERRLAGAVLADERVDLAGAQLERRALERLHTGVGLGHVGRAKHDLAHRRSGQRRKAAACPPSMFTICPVVLLKSPSRNAVIARIWLSSVTGCPVSVRLA